MSLSSFQEHIILLDEQSPNVNLLLKMAIPGLVFFIFVFSIQQIVNVQDNFLPMTGWEPRTSGIGSDCPFKCKPYFSQSTKEREREKKNLTLSLHYPPRLWRRRLKTDWTLNKQNSSSRKSLQGQQMRVPLCRCRALGNLVPETSYVVAKESFKGFSIDVCSLNPIPYRLDQCVIGRYGALGNLVLETSYVVAKESYKGFSIDFDSLNPLPFRLDQLNNALLGPIANVTLIDVELLGT